MDQTKKPILPGKPGNTYGRWKPGQSGNPKGRPIGRPFKEALEQQLTALAQMKGIEPEQAMGMIAAAHIAKCMSGDMAAIKEFADRIDGKVPNPIGGTDELPPITAFAWKPTEQIETSGEPSIAHDPSKPSNLDGSPSVDSGIATKDEFIED